MLRSRTRSAAAAWGVAGLLASAVAATAPGASAVSALPAAGAGTLAAWGVTDDLCTTPVSDIFGTEAGGPWTAVSATPNANDETIALSAAGKLVRVRASTGPLGIPPALDDEQVVAVDHYGTAKAAAVTSTGAVQIWGNDRSYDPGRWEPEALGGKALDVAVGTSAAVVLLDDGTIGVIDKIGPPYEKVAGIDDAVEIRTAATGFTVRIEGGGLRSFTNNGIETTATLPSAVRGESLADPIVDFTMTNSAVTKSGKVISWSGIPDIDDYVVAAGTKITHIATAGTGPSAWRAALTDQHEIIVWGPEGDTHPCHGAMTTIPEELEGRRITAIEGDANAFYAIGAERIPAAPGPPTVTAGGVTQGTFGSAVSLSAAVTGAKGAATGTVTFSGAGINATAALSGGQASVALPSNLAVGSTAVTVSYSGDANYVAASTVKTLTIVRASTSSVSAKVTKKPKKNKAGKVQVTASSRLSVRPGGKVTVTFTKGKKKITRNGTLRNGKVIIKTPKLAKGTWKITAQYKGDSRYNPRAAKAIKAKIK